MTRLDSCDGPSGAAEALELPPIDEHDGETAQEAEARAVRAMREWLDGRGRRAGGATGVLHSAPAER